MLRRWEPGGGHDEAAEVLEEAEAEVVVAVEVDEGSGDADGVEEEEEEEAEEGVGADGLPPAQQERDSAQKSDRAMSRSSHIDSID